MSQPLPPAGAEFMRELVDLLAGIEDAVEYSADVRVAARQASRAADDLANHARDLAWQWERYARMLPREA